MPVTQRDINNGRVNIENYARAHGSLHTQCEPDPQMEGACPRCKGYGEHDGCPRCGE